MLFWKHSNKFWWKIRNIRILREKCKRKYKCCCRCRLALKNYCTKHFVKVRIVNKPHSSFNLIWHLLRINLTPLKRFFISETVLLYMKNNIHSQIQFSAHLHLKLRLFVCHCNKILAIIEVSPDEDQIWIWIQAEVYAAWKLVYGNHLFPRHYRHINIAMSHYNFTNGELLSHIKYFQILIWQ